MNIKRLTIGDLEFFLELAMLGSIREVARSKSMEVAQASRSLKRIEKLAGKTFFERSHRGMILTPEGQEFRSAVEKSLKEIDVLESSATESRTKLNGVGAAGYLMSSLVLPVTGCMRGDETITDARIVELPPDRLVLSGLRGIIMLAFHAGELDWPSTWETRKIGKLEWKLVGAKKYFPETKLNEKQVLENEFIYPVYWSPEGLRRTHDSCPVPLEMRKMGTGVSSVWMAMDHLTAYKSLAYFPRTMQTMEDDRFVELEVPGWKPLRKDVYVSAHVERLSKKLFDKITETSKAQLKSIAKHK